MSQRNFRFIDRNYKSRSNPSNQPHPCAEKAIGDFEKIKSILESELDNNPLYKSVWNRACEVYGEKKKKKTLPQDYFSSSVPKECIVAIIAYTLPTALYQDFNKRFREMTSEDSWNQFPYKSLYSLLYYSSSNGGIINEPPTHSVLYRGIDKHRFNPKPEVGEDFYFDTCASCSIYENVIKIFMPSGTGTVVVLENGAEEAIGIAKYSFFEREGEVLVFPTNRFKVKKFVRGKHNADLLILEEISDELSVEFISMSVQQVSISF